MPATWTEGQGRADGRTPVARGTGWFGAEKDQQMSKDVEVVEFVHEEICIDRLRIGKSSLCVTRKKKKQTTRHEARKPNHQNQKQTVVP